MATGIGVGEGTYDAATKTLTFATRCPDFATGRYVPSRMTDKMVDADHMTMQAYGPGPDGGEMLKLQVDYTRAK
jgi:hypothetical protein